MLRSIEQHPDAMWKTDTIWSFKNQAKIYGSPMFDASWNLAGGQPSASPMLPDVLEHLRSVDVPFKPPRA